MELKKKIHFKKKFILSREIAINFVLNFYVISVLSLAIIKHDHGISSSLSSFKKNKKEEFWNFVFTKFSLFMQKNITPYDMQFHEIVASTQIIMDTNK